MRVTGRGEIDLNRQVHGDFAVDLGRNRADARFSDTLAAFKGSPADQALFGGAHLLRCVLADSMVVRSARAQASGDSVPMALLTGALIDLGEALPCFLVGVLHVGCGTARAVVGSLRR